jgi:putative membrane protein insertion efficiency factor
MSFAARALLVAVRVYQSFFSALMPSACKFYPSCSHYAAEALRVHGARRGTWLALRRLSRCHPFTKGGVDLVPEAEEFSVAGSARQLDSFRSDPFRDVLAPSGSFAARSENPQTEVCATKEVHS